MTQLILHIDIDFFVDPVVYYRADVGPRPNGREFRAESLESVKKFAEKQCRLSPKKKLPGEAVVHNDEVFDHLERYVREGILIPPFEFIHIDAHADLGVGENDLSFARISTDLLHRPISERTQNLRDSFGRLAFGNWLAFSLACRWISALTIVRHPNAGDDLHAGYFVEYLIPKHRERPARRELNIKMQPLTRDELETRAWQRTGAWGRKLQKAIEEPLIPATVVERDLFRLDRRPDFLFLCQSPGYSPPSADKIFRALKSDYLGHLRIQS